MSQITQAAVQPERPLTPQDLEGGLIQPGHPLFGIIWINRERMSGAPCFTGTRVPIKNLFDYLQGGEPLGKFLDAFKGVTREQAQTVIALAARALLDQLSKPQAGHTDCAHVTMSGCSTETSAS